MLGELSSNPLGFLLWLIALVIAITIHEFAHAWAAEQLGDPTPRLMGRLTLNPLAHLDPLGTIMLLIARFGWGKPVQFDPFNLRNPRRDGAMISIAGPVSNLILAIACAIVLRFLFPYRFFLVTSPGLGIAAYFFMSLLQPLIVLNVVLAVFNLVPIHPLDGFKIVGGILPENFAKQWAELEGYGMIFLIFLILPFAGSSAIHKVISPVIDVIISILLPTISVI
ncbi:site-2 protease family protein [Candidatus Gottesmanbacteria bacterium]|nr:site-2 protease family protein [Candidatus Gottesmanbacteria bacterium]